MRVLGDESYHKEIHRREIEGTQVGALSQRNENPGSGCETVFQIKSLKVNEQGLSQLNLIISEERRLRREA